MSGRGGVAALVARAGAAAALIGAAGVAFFGSLAAQTPVTAAGLGYPVPPLDARAAALGGTGIGLLGGTFSLRNPADLTQHRNSGLSSSMAPEALTVEMPNGSGDTGRTRFPVVRWILPLEEWSLGFGFGGELDQDWDLRLTDTLRVAVGDFPYEEFHQYDGGVSTIDLSVARRLGPISIGVSGQRLTGSLRQLFERRFAPEIFDPDDPPERDPIQLQTVGYERQLTYGAWRLRTGAALQAGERVLLSGSLSWTSNLELTSQDPGQPDRSFDMPMSAEVGGSARLVPALLLTAAGGWTEWSTVGGVQPGMAAHDVRWVGGGLELTGWRLLGVEVPLRLGGRVTELPFAPEGMDQAVERAVTFGFGTIVRGGVGELGTAFEIGRRGDLPATGFEESFRRTTVTFTVRP